MWENGRAERHVDHSPGFFCLSIPELLFCQYKGDEVSDQLVIENLVSSGYVTCETKDLRKAEGGQDYLRSTLETLAQVVLVFGNNMSCC